MLAIPQGVLPEEDLNAARSGGDGLLGPFAEIEMLLIVLDGGSVAQTRSTCQVLVVDCSASIVSRMGTYRPFAFEYIVYGSEEEQPYALPDPSLVLLSAKG